MAEPIETTTVEKSSSVADIVASDKKTQNEESKTEAAKQTAAGTVIASAKKRKLTNVTSSALIDPKQLAVLLEKFDAAAKEWFTRENELLKYLADKGNGSQPVNVMSRRGDFIFFLLGLKPAVLLCHGVDAARYCNTLIEQVWRPLLREYADITFTNIDWVCNPNVLDPRGSFRNSVVVTNTRHTFCSKVAEAFYPEKAANQLNGEELNIAIAIALDYPTPELGGEEMPHFEYMEGPGCDDMVVEYMSYFGKIGRFRCPFARCVKHFLEYHKAYQIALGETAGLRLRLNGQELTIGVMKAVMCIHPRSGTKTHNNLQFMLRMILDEIARVEKKPWLPTHGMHPILEDYWNQIETNALEFIKRGPNADWYPPKEPFGYQGKVKQYWFRPI